MNTRWSKIAIVFWGLCLLGGCSPDDYTYRDNTVVDLNAIDSIGLIPNQLMVLADGHAQLDLRPRLYSKKNYLVPDERVKEEWLEYVSDEGVAVTRHFSTSDASLIGKTLNVRVKLKGTHVVSEPVSFKVEAPLDKKYASEIVIPVVLHIVQTAQEIEEYHGRYELDRLELLLQKLNNVFGGLVSFNPVGVDSHIRFKFAQYDPYGKKMTEAGIDRLVVKEIDATDHFIDFLIAQHLVWPAEKYMNIWLISDREKKVKDFGFEVSEKCMPHYVNEEVAEEDIPEGLDLQILPDGAKFLPEESGVIYKLQELDELDRSFGPNKTNELIYYVGRYLGLYPTCTYIGEGTDYCDDTIDYYEVDEDANDRWYKTMNGCYFRAENIMDDPRGVHCSVSKDQSVRMRWVLNNCPDRAAWKSNFAFTGK